VSAKLKFRTDRREWVVQCHQFGQRWKQQVADEPTGKAVTKAINARMRQGEDMRPASTRTAATPRPPSGGDTVRTFGDRWLLDGWGSRKMSTNDSYERMLRIYIDPILGDVPIAAMTRARCVAFCKGLLTTKSASTGTLIGFNTRDVILGTLRSLLGAAVEAELLQANPASRLEKHLKSPDEIPEEVAVWTPAEADRFLETVRTRRPHYYALFFVALRTGLRLGELLELRWDLDFKHAGAIHVQRAYAVAPRETLTIAADGTRTRARVEGASRVTSPKSKKGRLVDTSAEVERVLADHRAAQRAAAFKRGEPAPSLVFTGVEGRRLIAPNLRARLLTPLIKAARVTPIHIHALRHTFASMLLSRGERLDYVSRQLGHAEITTTERVYRHWIPEDSREAAARRARLDDVWRVDTVEGDE
jgi:integrase